MWLEQAGLVETLDYSSKIKNLFPPVTTIPRWQPPPSGFIKINVDATVKDSMDFFSIGMVGRDHAGVVLFTMV